jgi:hypothetical protein
MKASTCAAVVAQFSMTTGTGSEVVRVDPSTQYQVNWHTDRCVQGPCRLSSDKTYRIRVAVGLAELGFTDVALSHRRTLPIKFRIEKGAVAVLPASGGVTTIGPAGGAIALANEVGLVIPAGALSTPTAITVAPTTSYPATDGEVGTASGTKAVDFQPEGLTFNGAATLTIGYDPSTVPADIPEDELRLHTVTAGLWDEISGSVIDLADHTLTAPIEHFSIKFVRSGLAGITKVQGVLQGPPPSTGSVVPILLSGFTVTAGRSMMLSAQPTISVLSPSGGARLQRTTTNRLIYWTLPASAQGIATVTQNLLTAVAPGSAMLVASGGQAVYQAPLTVVPAPTISSFGPPATIRQGGAASLTPVFAGGNGRVDPGGLSVTSGVPIRVAPASTTAYALTVTNPAGDTTTVTTTVTVLPISESCDGQIQLSASHDRFTSLSCTRIYRSDGSCPQFPLSLVLDAYNDGNDWCDFVIRVNGGGTRVNTGHFTRGYAQAATFVAAGDMLDIDLWTPGLFGFAGSGGGTAHWPSIPPCADIRLVAHCR